MYDAHVIALLRYGSHEQVSLYTLLWLDQLFENFKEEEPSSEPS